MKCDCRCADCDDSATIEAPSAQEAAEWFAADAPKRGHEPIDDLESMEVIVVHPDESRTVSRWSVRETRSLSATCIKVE